MSAMNATRGRAIISSSPQRNVAPAPVATSTMTSGSAQVEECLAVAALAMEDWGAVARHCERLAGEFPERFDIWLDLAAAQLHLGQGAEAVAAARQALRLKPSSGDAQLNLALALHLADEGAEAVGH